MYFLEQLKHELAQAINNILKQEVVTASLFAVPPDTAMGDLSLPCFGLAKELKLSPALIAEKIAEQLVLPVVKTVTIAGPYVNFQFSEQITEKIVKEILKKTTHYGQTTLGKKKRVMLEYANGNTHKEYHVGHLRNIAFGDAVNRILAFNGYTSIPVSYINDFGIHVAKTLWHYIQTKPAIPKNNKGYFLGNLYAEATAAIEAYPEKKKEVGEIMKAIESRAGDIYTLWKKTRQWSLDQFKEVNKELHVKFVTTFYESDFIAEGLKVVQQLIKKGILIKSEGAIIANLEDYNLGVLVVIRSDGTALYPVADLALTDYKVKKYKLDTSLWVVDIRQGQYLHQLFKVLELSGLQAELAHLPYEFVKLPSGMMSSRSGNIIAYEDLKVEALKRTEIEIKKRHAEWSVSKIKKVAEVLAFGALKFEMVKVNGEKVITFDMDTALRFEGYTAAYVQYTYARIQSLVRKAKTRQAKLLRNVIAKDLEVEQIINKEKNIALVLGRFSSIIMIAGQTYQPSEIARYLYELAQVFNEYYHAVPIVQNKQRLALATAVGNVLKTGLDLLGVKVIEEM